MDLQTFLQNPSFSKYEKEVKEFEREFLEEKCEMFLWPPFREQMKAMEFTKELSRKHDKVVIHDRIDRFIKRIASIHNEDIVFIYPEDYSPKYLICQEIVKNAKEKFVIDNIFDEDDTKNWIVVFDKSAVESIGMMYYIVYSADSYTGDNFGGYKLFGKGLMYYADCLQYEGNVLEPEWPKPLAHFQGNQYRRDTNPRIILESRKVTTMLIRLGYFNDEYELFVNLYQYLLPFLHKMYESTRAFVEQNTGDWKNKIKEIQSRLVADGVIVSKWKSEQTLFTLVKKIYDDALFQYRPRWLEPQNLDIYIPSLNLGIEYQGIQHYESVDFFGGDEALEYRKQLDERKRRLCEQNGMALLAWPYTDEISNKNLQKKIAEIL